MPPFAVGQPVRFASAGKPYPRYLAPHPSAPPADNPWASHDGADGTVVGVVMSQDEADGIVYDVDIANPYPGEDHIRSTVARVPPNMLEAVGGG